MGTPLGLEERRTQMGLADWFSTFCKDIQVNDRGTISSRYRKITHRLNVDYWNTTSETSHSLYVGSYGRNTAIQGFSDLDMIFRLPDSMYHRYNNHSGNGQSALLQAVRQSLRKTYPSSRIGADGQVVEISFTDGITFEVVPGFENADKSFKYPDTNNGGRWRTTNPRPEIVAIRSRDSDCKDNLVRLCRMMRAWKSKWAVPMGGLLIDTLAYQFIDDWDYKRKSYLYYDYMCRDFLKYLADQDRQQQWWRALGSGQYVYRQGSFEPKASKCYNIALEAIQYETSTPKKEWSAKQKWREIFGTAFPS